MFSVVFVCPVVFVYPQESTNNERTGADLRGGGYSQTLLNVPRIEAESLLNSKMSPVLPG